MPFHTSILSESIDWLVSFDLSTASNVSCVVKLSYKMFFNITRGFSLQLRSDKKKPVAPAMLDYTKFELCYFGPGPYVNG